MLVEYAEVVTARDGRRVTARACGSEGTNALWQGWLEFIPLETIIAAVRLRAKEPATP